MSVMSSEGAATAFARAAAAAIRRELAAPRWGSRRLLLRQLHGLPPAAIFEALLDGVQTRDITVYPDGPGGNGATITSIVADGGTLIIPYLVDTSAATPNSGNEGFAASLRTHFLEGAQERRVLLILAADPQETIASTTDDAATLPAVSFDRLCKAAVLPPPGHPQPSRLLRVVVDDYVTRVQALAGTPTWQDAERLRDWVDRHHDDPDAAVGASLHELGMYVSDPDLTPATAARRLEESASWRQDLDQLVASPGQDLARVLSRRVGAVGIDKVLSAQTVRGTDYAGFTLSDLKDRGARPPVELDAITPVEGARLALQSGSAIALWLPVAGATLKFKLTRPLGRTEQARLWWHGSQRALLPVRGQSAEASVAAPPSGEWRFGWLELLDRGSVTARYQVGAVFSDGDAVAFEDALDIDTEMGGFNCGETPLLTAWDSKGRSLGAVRLDHADDDGDDPVRHVSGWIGSVRVGPVPVIPARADDDDGGGGGGAAGDGEDRGSDRGDGDSGGGAPGDGDEGAGDDGGTDNSGGISGASGDDGSLNGGSAGRGELPAASAEQPTLAHAMLAFRQQEWPGGATAAAGGTLVTGRYGAVRLKVHPRSERTELLPVEQAILAHPEWCMFSVAADGSSCSPMREFPRPEPEWASQLDAFLGARVRYFDAAVRAGSTYALDPRSEVAGDYTAAYRNLLNALPRDATSRAEYDDLLLVDRTEVRGIADALVAPTSPLTVAWHAALADRFSMLAAAGAAVDRADIAAFTPQHLLPVVMSFGDWYEAVPSKTALLWRRYAPLASSNPGALERNATFIASRIRFFLSVHPGLNRPETTVAVTFADADDGSAVVEAVRHFFSPERTLEMYRRPRLRAVIAGGGTEARRAVNSVLAGATSSDLDRIVQTRCDFIVSETASPPEFSDVSFLFRSPGSRGVRPVALDQRAPTTYSRSLCTTPGRIRVPDAEYVFATGTFAAPLSDDATDLEAIQYRSLELVGGQGGERLQPGWTRMVTATAAEADLADWYDQSAWVVHLDRLVGLEAFADADSGRTLLEYEEGADPAYFGYDGITGTRIAVQPYIAALRRALAGVASPRPDEARALMRVLEAVSGRWALQIVQRPLLKVLERTGTACAIRHLASVENALDADGGDSFNALVALEEIVPGFPEAGIPQRLRASRTGRAMCDDLLLLSVQPRGDQAPLVQATVIEVKFSQGGGADYSTAAEQVEETISWLQGRFCDAGELEELRGRDLAELIRSSHTRNTSFGLAPPLPAGAEDSLARISAGDYELDFGHWRRDAYRRGLVIAVEPRLAGPMELTQLNAQLGPIDLVSIRRDAAAAALEMHRLAPPGGWARLRLVPPLASAAGGAQPAAPDSGSGSSPAASPATDTGALSVELMRDAASLDAAFARYALTVEPFDPALAQAGPSVIRFRTRAVGRLSISEVERRSRDISREVGAPGVIGIGDEPGFITVDVPRAQRQPVPMPIALQALDAHDPKPGALSFVAGVAPSGEVRIEDLSRLPHLLVSGATGSGKSVFLRGMLVELLRSRTPEQLRLMIVDPKRLDFAPFTRAPHLERGEIISDPAEALERLRATLEEQIDRRQPILETAGVSSAAEFYESGGSLDELPQLVILVDEFADLVLAGPDRRGFSEMIQRYAQLTRAYGIFLVLATQRPSVDVITGSIKANLSARVAFSLPSVRDSMTILDRGGAEDLLGDGDLLFYRNGKIERLQAPFATLADVRAVLDVLG
ncbi:FtsK/SpoIIIE domain-containing protein [Nocardia cerradoensis]|uniref:DNA translocase FtsK n=1 Tax=Nocardia cerradoensis TaxID=85688 RepID=A0A231GTA0_9NOCA|nr:FtsK/SpoIIIE domain-containing protein [Nocardia cerradoensis]NKY48398.1 DNA translocase FtsK [Nocardia cerradoensis]OXR39853.1 DNA translocase FtsK [Nocardia cerradoensis]